jgi:hypothetical protein
MEVLNILYIIIKTFIFASKKASDAPGFLRAALWLAETHAPGEIANMQFIVPAGARAFWLCVYSFCIIPLTDP